MPSLLSWKYGTFVPSSDVAKYCLAGKLERARWPGIAKAQLTSSNTQTL